VAVAVETTVTPEVIATAMARAIPALGSPLEGQWSMWINDAVRAINRRAAKLDVDTATLDPDDVDFVVREAVVEQVKHPDDATQVAISVDDGSVSKSYRSGRGRVTIIDEWWELLGLVPPSDGAFSVDMAAPAMGAHTPWCDLYFRGATCSCGVSLAGFPIWEP
jgi:hypothetical protein